MHKIAISQASLDRMNTRMGKLHPFDAIDPRATALLVVDMQNYFVKPGHQGEVPLAREIVPNINRLAAELRRRGGHVVWIRNGTTDTRESWSNYHGYLQKPERAERRLKAMDIGEDGYEYWHLNDIRPEDAQITKKRYSAFIQNSSDVERHLRDRGIDTLADHRHRHKRVLRKLGARRHDAQFQGCPGVRWSRDAYRRRAQRDAVGVLRPIRRRADGGRVDAIAGAR